MDDLDKKLGKVSSMPKVRQIGPTSPLRTLGDAAQSPQDPPPPPANDAGEAGDPPESKPTASSQMSASDAAPLTDNSAKTAPPAAAKPTPPAGAVVKEQEDKPQRATLSLTPSQRFGAYELAPGRQGAAYPRLELNAHGGAGPYRFAVTRSFADLMDPTRRLPPGLKLSEDGIVTGAPTRGGTYRFTVEATDAAGQIGRAEYSLSVRLDLDRYKAYFDAPSGGKTGQTPRKRRISDFDLTETDADGQPVAPLSLCEFLAYKSAQAYLHNDPLDPKNALSQRLAKAHPRGEITHLACFDSNTPLKRYSEAKLAKRGPVTPRDKAPEHWDDLSGIEVERLNEWRAGLDAQAFGFVFEGRAYIVCRGSSSVRDWRVDIDNGLTTDAPRANTWWENVKFRVGLRGKKVNITEVEKQLIGGPDPERYLRPARAIGFAAAWASLRDQVENWLDTVPPSLKKEFVFSGHSLGGAMAIVGAQEFSEKLGRRIHAVVTFGAPCVGRSSEHSDAATPGEAFVDNYRKLQDGELDKRTLRLETSSDPVPRLLQFKNFAHVGQTWEVEFPPLPSPFTRFLRGYVTGPLLWLARGSLGYETKSLSDLPRKALGYAAFYGLPLVSRAVGAHGAYDRYAGYLSTLSYRKIRQNRIGDIDDEEQHAQRESQGQASLDSYFLANALYDQHLTRIYAPPTLRDVRPNYVRSPSEERRLAQRFYGPDQATYLF